MQSESRVRDYMDSQPDMNARMRSILIDWLTEVHCKFELMPETLYLTINIVDRYLSVQFVSRRELQLVGIASMVIACKYEEVWAPQVVFSLICNHCVENLFMLFSLWLLLTPINWDEGLVELSFFFA
jgi:hypothetical protein